MSCSTGPDISQGVRIDARPGPSSSPALAPRLAMSYRSHDLLPPWSWRGLRVTASIRFGGRAKSAATGHLTQEGRAMLRNLVVGFCLSIIAGCAPVADKLNEPGPSAGSVERRETRIIRDTPQTESCELKNPAGTGECDDGRHASAPRGSSANRVTPQTGRSDPPTQFSPAMCRSIAQGGVGFFAFYGTLLTGNLGKLGEYCENLEREAAQQAAPSSSSSGTGGSGIAGCVWKGRAYPVGSSIYHTQGRILSSDLRVNGQDFGALSGRAGPWQWCECQSSSRKWGCV